MINFFIKLTKFLGILFILFIIAASVLPSKFEFTDSRRYNIPHLTIYTYLSDMNYRMEWHYIKEKDPYAVIEISERENGKGPQLVWAINNREILGREFPTAIKQNFIEYQCYETYTGSEHKISYALESFPDGSIKVDFKHQIRYNIPSNLLSLFFQKDYFNNVYQNHLSALQTYINERGLVDEIITEHISENNEEEDPFLDNELKD